MITTRFARFAPVFRQPYGLFSLRFVFELSLHADVSYFLCFTRKNHVGCVTLDCKQSFSFPNNAYEQSDRRAASGERRAETAARNAGAAAGKWKKKVILVTY